MEIDLGLESYITPDLRRLPHKFFFCIDSIFLIFFYLEIV